MGLFAACGGNDVDPRVIAGGGVGDGEIDGEPNVYVIDTSTDAPIAGATVQVGTTSPATDAMGLVTVTDLEGKQTITVVASGYRSAQWVGVCPRCVELPPVGRRADCVRRSRRAEHRPSPRPDRHRTRRWGVGDTAHRSVRNADNRDVHADAGREGPQRHLADTSITVPAIAALPSSGALRARVAAIGATFGVNDFSLDEDIDLLFGVATQPVEIG